MKINEEYFVSLKEIYKKEPCKVLPYSFWKAEDRVNSEMHSFIGTENETSYIYGSMGCGLEFYWSNDRALDSQFLSLEFADIVAASNSIMIHDDYFKKLKRTKFNHKTSYFRLIHENKEIQEFNLPKGFSIHEVDIEAEISVVSEFISACYENLKPSYGEVKRWTAHKVFDNRLWIWIKDDQNEELAALGIAEIDARVPEASLEWIQVHPNYQGNGLGKILVLELLKRMEARVNFTTVSGACDNIANPERLYRSCGFVGDDVWWFLSE